MGWGGVYREIAAPERLVFTEVFDDAWYSGEAIVTQEFVAAGDFTLKIPAIAESIGFKPFDVRDAGPIIDQQKKGAP